MSACLERRLLFGSTRHVVVGAPSNTPDKMVRGVESTVLVLQTFDRVGSAYATVSHVRLGNILRHRLPLPLATACAIQQLVGVGLGVARHVLSSVLNLSRVFYDATHHPLLTTVFAYLDVATQG